MPTSLRALLAAAPSGRTRPLLLDSDDYATAVIRQGTPPPWTDIAALTGQARQVGALLRPDAVWVDVGALYAELVADRPDLAEAMRARTRTGYPLRALLADGQAREHLVATLTTLAQACRAGVVMQLPSPARWLAWAQASVGRPLDSVDEDQADSAGMYLAEWLGGMGRVPVALVVLDARARPGEPASLVTESLAGYSAIGNVAAHFEWTLALLDGSGVQAGPDEPSIGLVDQEFWLGGAELPAGDVLLATIPAAARPEHVLDQLAAIG